MDINSKSSRRLMNRFKINFVSISTRQKYYFGIISFVVIIIYFFLIPTKATAYIAKLMNTEACPLPSYFKKLSNSLILSQFDNINSIPGTTGPGIPNLIRSTLSTKYFAVNHSATTFYGAETAVDRLAKECEWNSTFSKLNHPECLDQFHFKRESSPFDISHYYNEVDIVIPTIRDLEFLESWKLFFENFHLIIIQDGDPTKFLRIPIWANYELYNRNDIERILGKDYSWIISSQDASIRNFGFLVSKKTYIYTIDDDCLPAENITGQPINALFKHIQNLVTNSTPYFFNTLYDPYRDGSDFVRGYPFSLRQGVPTAISHGIWLNAPDYDAPTQLLKVNERNTHFADVTITVPAGVLYPMCSMNVAFNRKLIGAAFMQGLMGLGMPWGRYDDMFAGWASKVIADHLSFGVKTGSPYIRHNKASNPFTNLKKEYMGLFWQEDLISFFQHIRFSSSATTPEKCYLELAQMIRKHLSYLNEYFNRLATAMEIWIHLWKKSQKNLLKFEPSRQNQPKRTMGKYAIFTICRSEGGYLSIWLKYYRQYFSDVDIYILDNDSTDNSTLDLTVNVQRVHSEKYFDHQWLVDVVQNKLKDLLKMGYKSVLFTEIDEIVMPDPLKYPFGLMDYISRVQHAVVRVTAYDLRHDVKTEAKLNLSQPLLQQRRFWMRHESYDKPSLTNMSIHWATGFHVCQEPAVRDDDLKMFHLQRMDHDFYMQRAEWKSRQNIKMEDVQKGMGVQHVYRGQRAEKFFAEIVGPVSEIPEQYRSTARF